MFDLFVTPLVSVFVTGYLTLSIIGPVFVTVENGLLDGVQMLIAIPLGIGSFIMGGLYASTVVAGVHHMYTIIDLGQIAKYGMTFWLPLASAANLGQGGAALAVALKTKNKKLKSMALPSALSAFMGITEPAIFGVNLRFGKPFIMASIGGACGALVASVTSLGATGTGVTGIFGILLCLNSPLNYLFMMVVSVGAAFVLTWLFGFKDEKKEAKKEEVVEEVTVQDPAFQAEKNTVYSPLKGNVIPLEEVKDETFAAGILGQGVGIEPSEGKVVSPVKGKIETLFDTKHAVGITSEDGVELLIHVGLNTVELGGKYYTAHVAEGDSVEAGQVLLTFDMEQIKAAGYDVTTPVLVTNADQYEKIEKKDAGQTEFLEKLIQVG